LTSVLSKILEHIVSSGISNFLESKITYLLLVLVIHALLN